jgi:hypothetical protein
MVQTPFDYIVGDIDRINPVSTLLSDLPYASISKLETIVDPMLNLSILGGIHIEQIPLPMILDESKIIPVVLPKPHWSLTPRACASNTIERKIGRKDPVLSRIVLLFLLHDIISLIETNLSATTTNLYSV